MPDPSASLRTETPFSRNGHSVQPYLFADFSPAPPAPGLTVASIVEQYLAVLELRVSSGEFSREGLANVRRDLRRFAAWRPAQLLADCRRHDLIDWLTANPQWKSNSTKARNLAEIAACFGWAEQEELIAKNPYRRPKGLRLRTRRRPDAEPGHYVAFLRRGSRQLRRILFFIHNTGVRPCEARRLKWSMILWDDAAAVQEDHKAAHLQRDPRPRIIGLDPCLLRFLRNLYRQLLPGQEFVFLDGAGGPWKKDALDRNFHRVRDRILRDPKFARYGVHDRITIYSFRHGYTTEGIEGGIGERQMADQLGHSDTRLIAHYSHAATKTRHLRRVACEVRKQRRRIRREDS